MGLQPINNVSKNFGRMDSSPNNDWDSTLLLDTLNRGLFVRLSSYFILSTTGRCCRFTYPIGII